MDTFLLTFIIHKPASMLKGAFTSILFFLILIAYWSTESVNQSGFSSHSHDSRVEKSQFKRAFIQETFHDW